MRKIRSQRIVIFIKVYPFIKSERKLYVILGGLQAWTLVLSLISPMLYLLLINNVMVGKDLKLLPLVIGGYIGVYLLQTFGSVVNKRFYNKLFLKFNLKIKTQLLKIYTKMGIKAYATFDVGDLKNRMESDVTTIENFLNTHILGYFYAIASALVIMVILFIMSPLLAVVGMVMVPVSFWFVRIMGKKSKRVSESQRELQGKYESFLHGTFQNWKEIKANNLEANRNDVLQEYRGKLSKLFVKNQIYWYVNRTFIAFKDFFITRMNLYFIGGLLIISGHMNVGVLLAFMNYFDQFFTNIGQVTDSILGLKNDSANIDRVLEILNTDVPDKPKVNQLADGITISNLCYKYTDEQEMILANINLTIAPKEHVGIVGRSGCGKTTLAKLIMGMYEPLSGSVKIGGHDINKIAFQSVAQKVGIVLQEPPMFNFTIRENLQFAKKRASDDELIKVCKQANIYDFIDSLPDKFDTVIGERGIKLSGGQKQRLSIARTLLQNPDIVIFDEATSSLDSENEMAIVGAIKELSKDKTVVTISHRLSTILMCTRIVVTDEGRIVAIDTHENLNGQNETYDLLFKSQYKANPVV